MSKKNIHNKSLFDKLANGYSPYLFLFVISFLVYFQTLFFNYTHLDDYLLLSENSFLIDNFSDVAQLWKKGVFQVSENNYYRPVLMISFLFNNISGGGNLIVFHFANIMLHAICCGLIFYLFTKLNYEKKTSLLITLLFAAHPVLSQAVAWIPGRNDSLLTLFILLSFISFLNFIETKKSLALVLHFLFFSLALFTKETAGIFPVICFSYWYFIRRNDLPKKQIIYFAVLWFLIAMAFYAIRYNALNISEQVQLNIQYANIGKVFYGIIIYIGKLFFPFNLSPIPVQSGTILIWGIAAIAILFFIISKGINNKKIFWFGAIWFFIFFIPVMIFQLKLVEVDFLEHRIYLPFIGFLIALMEINIFRKMMQQVYLVMLIAILFSFISISHSKVFSNGITFWKEAVETSPKYFYTHFGLGNLNLRNNNWAEGEKETRTSIALYSGFADAHIDMGAIFQQRKMYDEAEKEFETALQLNPNFTQAIVNLGAINYLKNNLEKAEHYLNIALQKDNSFVQSYYFMAMLKNKQGQYDEAINSLNKVLTLSPEQKEDYLFLYGESYLGKQDYDTAIKYFSEAIKLNPNVSKFYLMMSKAYFKKGDEANTNYYFEKAANLNPDLRNFNKKKQQQ